MSRVRQEVASVIFQADARKANASMEALQEKANSLNDAITGVKQQIEALGNVAPDHQGLISYQQQLRKLNSDLKDVQKTMSDYMRGVKAADQLWQSYMRGDIEGLSLKAIKAGQNGLRKRMENLSPGNPDDQKTLRAYEEVIKEADLVVNKFKTDAAETIRILQQGGTVSEKAMRQARDGVKSLMESYEEGSKENREYAQQYEYLAAKVSEFAEAQRRAKGEIVDANDARRAAVRLTRDGAEAAAREREAQDAVITAQQKEIEQTRALRLEKEKEIEQTNSQMATNMRLADAAMAERRQMEDDYQASLGAIARENREQAQQQAQAAHDEADQMRANAQLAEQTAQQKRTAYEQETQTVNQLDGEVKQLTEDLHALSAEPVKPKVDTSEIDALKQELQGIENELTQMGGMHTADMKAFNERLWRKQDKMKEMAAKYRETATDPDADFYNFGNKAKKIIKSFAAGGDDRRQDLMASIAERGGYLEKLKELESEHRAIVKQRTEYLRATDETGKHDWDEAIRQLDELDGLYASVINILKDYKQEFEKLKPADDAQVEKYDQLTERRAALLEKIASVEKQSAQAEKESATTSDELQRKQAELTAKTDELAQAKQRQAKAQGEMNTAEQQAAKAQDDANQKQVEAIQLGEKAAQAEREAATEQERHNEVLQRQDEKIAKLQNDYDALDDTLRKQEGELTAYDQKVAQSEQAIAEAERKKAQARELSAKDMRDAIAALRERNDAIGEANPEWEKNERLIAQYNQRLEEMKQRSDAIRREPVEQMMTQRMENLSNLSRDALTETKKFWQAMYDGADQNDPKLADIEKRLKDINAEEAKRAKDRLRSQAVMVKGGMYNYMDENELREAINAAREYQKTFTVGGTIYNEYSEAIAKAEEHLRKYGVETERAKLKQEELDSVMRQQLQLGTELSESALKAQENYWRRLIDDPKTAAESLDAYKQELERTMELQKQQAEATRNERAARLDNPANFGNLSEAEIREAIEAGKQLIQTYETGDARAQTLGENIVKAEEHLKHYGVEAARTAQREADATEKANKALQERISLMIKQWNEDRQNMSDSALKAHERFWQQLIDDPKTAAESLDWYRENLAKVKREIEAHANNTIRNEGVMALGFFQRGDYENASANEVQEQAKALKKWRDTLPQKDDADIIAEIDGYLQKTGQSAKKAAEDVMSLDDALELAAKAGENYYLQNNKEGFVASPQQIQAATKAINERRDAVIKLIQENKRLGLSTEAEEEELQDLTKKLRDLKFEQDNVNMSQEKMRRLMEQPAQAVSLDELRAAIKRADGELRRMEGSLGKNSKEYKAFAEQVKAAKNTLKDMEGAAKASASAWEKAVSRLKTYVGLYMGFNILWQKMMGTIGDLHELSDRMGEVGKTTQMASGEIDLLTDNLKKIDTRTPVTELLSLSAAAGQLGLKSREDVEGFTEAANKMLVALPEMGRDGATQMMKVALATGEVERIRKQMEEGMIEGSSATAVAMEKIASTIDQLRANSAAAAPQITDFVKRVGAVGAQSGITIDQVAALGSTVDALGMRVEMSATALSRMIPAIKNNAFEVAKAIGMAPEALRHMFDEAGGGMNAMLAIFQHIKDSGMNADDIEKMMGMGGMQDIMKDLNQQGARAGIVFAGLSQNVDVLREHLGIAHDAYEENIAIQQEYDRMNETTAAKWERLANKVEEMFVGSGTQSALGKIYDMLTWIVDLITGPLNTAFLSATGAVLAIKSGLTEIPSAVGNVFDYLKDSAAKASEALEKAANATSEISEAAEGVEEAGDAVGEISDALGDAKEAGEQAGEAMESATGAIEGMTGATKVSIFSVKGLKAAWKGLDTTMKANIIVAVIALLYTLGKALYNVMTSTNAQRDAVAKANQEADRAVEKLGVYFNRLDETKNALDEATKATEKMTDKTEKATEAEIKMTKAKEDHRAAIVNINQNYSKYLGFMLTEYDRAELLAAAHNKIAAAIRREILMKQKQAAIDENSSEASEGLTKDWSKFSEEMVEDNRMTSQQAADARIALKKFLPKSFTVGSDGKTLVASDELKKSLGSLYNENASLNELTAVWFARHLQQNYGMTRDAIKDITGIDYYKSDYGTSKGKYVWTTSKGGTNLRGDYLDEYFELQQKNAESGSFFNDDIKAETKTIEEESSTLVSELKTNIQSQIALLKMGGLNAKETEEAYQELARGLEGINENVVGLTAAEQKETENTIKTLLDQNKTVIDSKRLKKAREKIQQGFDAFDTLGDDSDKNIWGSKQPAESTDWKNMTAEQLVNRRKQMKDFVNAIQTDTDVKAVLEEDKALKKAIEAGMSSDMRTVIEWYNTERLKIQDELHARHLTNTGDWMDPKKERGAKKQFRDEMDAYLHELDAYYTERKTRIEQARNDEEITEGEAWRRTIQNDNEWQTRRAELQKLYSRKQQEVTKEELDAILHIIAERTGDSEAFVKAAIAKTNQFVDAIEKSGDKGAAIVHRWMSQVVLDTERSYLKAAQAIGKQMKFIEDTLAKERPYDGITKNLQDNLDKMGVLAAKYRRENEELARQGKEPKYSNEQITAQSFDEMAFYLRQAADAYSIDIDELLRRMVKEGMTATAEEISKSDMLKQAVMGQLRKTYQEVQDAVKKEASQIKKDVEIIWNDDARGIGGMSMKATFDKALAQLGMQQDSVSRANSLIGAGAASDNVASRLAMKQIEVQMRMQKAQYDMYRVQANQRMAALRAEAEEHRRLAKLAEKEKDIREASRQNTLAENALLDARNVKLSLGLTLAEETKKEEQQKAELLKIQEESQNRLYTSLREWADLLTSSLQGVFEASHAGDAEYYNERAKLDLTGKGGPGAGTYIVIDNAGTSDAKAHYEYLDERQALERQHEIEQQNAQAEAWKKLWDDINMKMSDQITDWLNASLQDAATRDNTDALNLDIDATKQNTEAVQGLTSQLAQGININTGDNGNAPADNGFGADKRAYLDSLSQSGQQGSKPVSFESTGDFATDKMMAQAAMSGIDPMTVVQSQIDADNLLTQTKLDNQKKISQGQKQSDNTIAQSTQATYSKMAAAMNMYGLAYQTMSNDNMDMTEKFLAFSLQAAGQVAIGMLTTDMYKTEAEGEVKLPGILGEAASQLGPIAGPIAFAAMTALLGGLMAMAMSKVTKAKSQISQVTGASVGAGRLATGMQTYAEGNVNEFTDPASLTPGRQYNVDGADGRTYRARYMGKDAKTHITNGPEFHLVGEKGREAIIDAHTTRLMQTDDTGIWQAIQTLYNGGRVSGFSTRRGRGVRAFAEGNINDFEDAMGGYDIATDSGGGGLGFDPAALQASLDRNSDVQEALLERLQHPLTVAGTGSNGVVAMYDKLKKEAKRQGVKYI